MKYIKPYESNSYSKEDLIYIKNFCEENLIELIDIGFSINIYTHNYNYIEGVIKIEISLPRSSYSYDSLKDYIIPFFDIIQDEYKIIKLVDRNQNYLPKDIFINGNGVDINQLDNLDLSKYINNMSNLKYINFLVAKK